MNTTGFTPPADHSSGSKGFLDPERVAAGFGLSEGMRVCDFGSGGGHFTIIIAKKVGADGLVTAIDILNEPLETLKSKASVEGLSNIQTVRANLEVLGSSGLPNDSQDMVLLANTLFQNQNKEPIIDEASRILKPEGTLIVIDWRKGTGGFGPPDNLRTDEEQMKQLVLNSNSFKMKNPIDAGVFHYGFAFQKV